MIIQFGYLPTEIPGSVMRLPVTLIQIVSKESVEKKTFWFANVVIFGKQFSVGLEDIRFGYIQGADRHDLFCDIKKEVAVNHNLSLSWIHGAV
jgi:hypothetical protein